MAAEIRNGKITISRRNMNRLFYGTHSLAQVLVNEGLSVKFKDELGTLTAVSPERKALSPIVGFTAYDEDTGAMKAFRYSDVLKFVTTIPVVGEKMRVKEAFMKEVKGAPSFVVRPRPTWKM